MEDIKTKGGKTADPKKVELMKATIRKQIGRKIKELQPGGRLNNIVKRNANQVYAQETLEATTKAIKEMHNSEIVISPSLKTEGKSYQIK